MDICGYAFIAKDATTGSGCRNLDKFIGKTVRVMEFADDGGVLVLNREGTELAMFDKVDVKSSFKCTVHGEVIISPELDSIEKMLYFAKAMDRVGGYNNIVKQMVVEASLHKGEFNDNFLWTKQKENEQV